MMVLQGEVDKVAEGGVGPVAAPVVGVEIMDEALPVGGVDGAAVFKAVGKMGAAGCVGTFGIALSIAAIVLFGIVVESMAVFDEVDAVGGSGEEVGVGVGLEKEFVGGSGVFAVGLEKGKAVAQADGIVENHGVWSPKDKVLQHVEGADVADLPELE